MGFKEVKLCKKVEHQFQSELDSGKTKLTWHSGEVVQQGKFWWVRVLAAVLVPQILAIPLLILSLFQNLFKKKKSVKGKVILISGAARGLGRAMALKFAKLGAIIACTDINGVGSAETAEMIRKAGGKAAGFTTNVAKGEDVEQLRTDVEKILGPVDILINNAALIMCTPATEWDENEIRAIYTVNIMSHLWMMKTFLPSMRERKSGHIVTMSSSSGLMPCPYLSLYGSSKAAIASLADNVRIEMEMLNEPIKFTTLYPMFINTSLEISSFCNLRMPLVKEDYATDAIINAILLEKENVTIPEYMWNVALWNKFMPKIFNTLSLKILSPTVSLADKKIRKAMPCEDIIEDTLHRKKGQ